MGEDNVGYEIYAEMLENRSEIDIDVEDFGAYDLFKLPTVEEPEEVWRRIDESGNTFLIYISHHQRDQETIAYLVVAFEDDISESAIPLFGFPTLDQKLLDRFRTGEAVFKSSDDF